MLCSDNADCVMCFSLTSRWCSFIRILTILSVSPMYTFPQEQGILHTPVELSGGLWSLGFFKICPICLGVWKWFECCIYLVFYRYGPLFLLCMRKWKRFFCPSHLVMVVCWDSLPYWCVYWLFYLYLFYHVCSFVRLVSDGWVMSVNVHCQRWWKLYVQVNW